MRAEKWMDKFGDYHLVVEKVKKRDKTFTGVGMFASNATKDKIMEILIKKKKKKKKINFNKVFNKIY